MVWFGGIGSDFIIIILIQDCRFIGAWPLEIDAKILKIEFTNYISLIESMSHDSETLSPFMAIVGMVNGMIGGLILLLPVYALQAGYITTLIVILVTCSFSYYSCYLCIIHLGPEPDLDYAILRHFNGNKFVKIFYDICVWSSLFLLNMEYFELIEIQWEGLIPPYQFTWINPAVNTVVLIILVFTLKYFQFGASLMAYGIISIVTYLIFLVWVVSTYNQGYEGVDFEAFGSGAVNLAAAMGQAFSIQAFFVPVIKKVPNPQKYTLYVLLAYIAGGLSYYFIGYAGAVGIWHRQYHGEKGSQRTIEGYFDQGAWQVNIIEAIYLIHLYSVFGEFLLIGKKRIFGVFNLQQSERGKVFISQIIYAVIIVGICFVVGYFQINIDSIIDINGAVIGFFFIYLIPAVLHIKCLYFSKGKLPLPQEPSTGETYQPIENNEHQRTTDNINPKRVTDIEIFNKSYTFADQDEPKGKEIKEPLLGISEQEHRAESGRSYSFSLPRGDTGGQQINVAESVIQYSHFYCNCNLQSYSRINLVLDWIFIVIMVGLGVFILLNGIYTVAK